MLRFSSACLAMQLAVVVPWGAASDQLEVDLGPQEIIIQLQRPHQILQAAGATGDVANPPLPNPGQIVGALRVNNRAVRIIDGRIQFRLLRATARSRLTLIEFPGGVQFHLQSEPIPADEELPHELLLDEQQSALIVRHYVDQCTELCQGIAKVCDLSLEQSDKLKAAAVVDATRFMRRLRGRFDGTLEQQLSRKLNPPQLQQEANRELSLGIHSPNSLFRKVLCSQITPEQRSMLCRWRAADLISEIDRHAELSLDAQVRLLQVRYPEPGQQADLYVKLNPQQREKLLETIVNSGESVKALMEWIDRQQRTNLLANIEPEQLVEFLTPTQVRAVMRHKGMLESRRQYFENYGVKANVRVEGGGGFRIPGQALPIR